MANIKVTYKTLEKEIAKILTEYGDTVFFANEDGLDAAMDILKEELVDATPVKTGEMKKKWKIITKYKNMRVIGNTKMAKNTDIPLINILEYSVVRGKPFVISTYNKSIDKMAAAYVAKVKKELT